MDLAYLLRLLNLVYFQLPILDDNLQPSILGQDSIVGTNDNQAWRAAVKRHF